MAALFRKLGRLVASGPLEPARLDVGGESLDIVFRRHAGARRLVLRLSPEGTAGIVTVPPGVTRTQALDFVARSRTWLEQRLETRGGSIRDLSVTGPAGNGSSSTGTGIGVGGRSGAAS